MLNYVQILPSDLTLLKLCLILGVDTLYEIQCTLEKHKYKDFKDPKMLNAFSDTTSKEFVSPPGINPGSLIC